MPTTLEKTMRDVRLKLDQARNTDNSKKFATTISENIYADAGTGNRVGVVIAEAAADATDVFPSVTVVIKEEEVSDTIAKERTDLAILVYDAKLG